MSSKDQLEMFQPTNVKVEFKSKPSVHNNDGVGVQVLWFVILGAVLIPIAALLTFILPTPAEDDKVLGMFYVIIAIVLSIAPYMWVAKKVQRRLDDRKQKSRDVENERFVTALAKAGFTIERGDVFSFYRESWGAVTNSDGVTFRLRNVSEESAGTVTLYLSI